MNTTTVRKGRIAFHIGEEDAPDGIAIPEIGRTTFGAMEVQETIDAWRKHLILPDGYAVVRAYYELSSWLLVIESAELPRVHVEIECPRTYEKLYERTDDGRLRATGLKEFAEAKQTESPRLYFTDAQWEAFTQGGWQ